MFLYFKGLKLLLVRLFYSFAPVPPSVMLFDVTIPWLTPPPAAIILFLNAPFFLLFATWNNSAGVVPSPFIYYSYFGEIRAKWLSPPFYEKF
jgi:hypothetical protein